MLSTVSSKDKILDSALALFSERGYDGASVNDICERAGLSKGGFYHHFPSKQALFVSLMKNWQDQLTQTLRLEPSEVKNAPQALLAMSAQAGMAFDAAHEGFPILVDFWRQAVLENGIWEEAKEPYEHFLRIFEELIRQGQAEGSLKPDLDPIKGATLLVALAIGYLLQAALYPDIQNWAVSTTQGITMLLKGMEE